MHNYELASIKRRLAAVFIDDTLMCVGSFALTLVVIELLPFYMGSSTLYIAIFLYFFFGLCFELLNNIVLSRLTRGKTLGKSVLDIQIRKEDGTPVGIKNIIKRWIAAIFVVLATSWAGCFVLYASVRVSKTKQGVHDLFGETIVVRSKTRRSIKILIWLLITAGICIAIFPITRFTVKLIDYIKKPPVTEISQELEVNTTPSSLSGAEGPIAEWPTESIIESGVLEYTRAQEFVERRNFDRAKVMIDAAVEKMPGSKAFRAYQCYIYTELDDAEQAFDVCRTFYKVMPHNPTVISNLLSIAYYANKCDSVVDFTKEISDIRMGSEYTDEDKAVYYGNAGAALVLCEVEPELGEKMLNASLALTEDAESQEIYQSYLDLLFE